MVFQVLPVATPVVESKDDCHEAARFQNHVCQLTWSFSFATLLDKDLGTCLYKVLMSMGRRLDEKLTPTTNHRCPSFPLEFEAWEPTVLLALRGISVVMKPPGWEVDAKGQLSRSGLYLSHFMQRTCKPVSPILALRDFEFGFIHRLDVPSSGPIL